MTFTAAGRTLAGSLAGGAYNALLDTRSIADGPLALTATLVDGVGNAATVTRNAIIDNTPPTVALAAAAGGYLRGVIQLSATASDATSGVSSLSILVNGTAVKTCAAALCAASFDTGTLQDGPFTVAATAIDNAGNAAAPASWTAVADNSSPAHFLVSPTAGATVTSSLLVAVNVADSDFDKVECSVGGKSLGVSHDPRFSATVDLSHTIDGALDVSCVAADLAGNQGTNQVTVTVHRWSIELSPGHVELRSRDDGGRVSVEVDGPNANILVPTAPWHLALVVPGGAPVPVVDMSRLGRGEDELVLQFDRGALVASIKAGIAAGLIEARKPVLVKLVSGTHVIDTDFITIAGGDHDDGREASNDRE